jgi:hypothetical protein
MSIMLPYEQRRDDVMKYFTNVEIHPDEDAFHMPVVHFALEFR